MEIPENIVITQDMLSNDLADVKEVANSIKITNLETEMAAESNSQRAMFYDKLMVKKWLYSNKYGSAQMRTSFNATINGSNKDIVSVSSFVTEQVGSFVNFENGQESGSKYFTNNPNAGSVNTIVRGKIRFSYTNPVTGIKTGITSDVNESFIFNCIN